MREGKAGVTPRHPLSGLGFLLLVLFLFLFVASLDCNGEALGIDQSQIWSTGGTLYQWIFTLDYGYQPIDLSGQIVSGLTDGAIVWLVDDGAYGSEPQPPAPPCCEPPSPPPPIPPVMPVTVTPEPNYAGGLCFISGVMFGWTLFGRKQ